jgi:hypothetical protein
MKDTSPSLNKEYRRMTIEFLSRVEIQIEEQRDIRFLQQRAQGCNQMLCVQVLVSMLHP